MERKGPRSCRLLYIPAHKGDGRHASQRGCRMIDCLSSLVVNFSGDLSSWETRENDQCSYLGARNRDVQRARVHSVETRRAIADRLEVGCRWSHHTTYFQPFGSFILLPSPVPFVFVTRCYACNLFHRSVGSRDVPPAVSLGRYCACESVKQSSVRRGRESVREECKNGVGIRKFSFSLRMSHLGCMNTKGWILMSRGGRGRGINQERSGEPAGFELWLW